MADLATAYVQIIPSAQGIQSGTLSALTGELSSANQATTNWQSSLQSIASIMQMNFAGSVISGVVGGIRSIGQAMSGAVQGAFSLATAAGQVADNLATMAAQNHVSVSSLQEWQYAGRFIDTSINDITSSMTRLTMNMSSKSAEASAAFRKLHVSIREGGQLRDTSEVFFDIIDALGKIPNEAQRDALAMELLGKSAKTLNPMIEAGSSAFQSLGAEAQTMGAVMSDSVMEALGGFDDAMQRFEASSDGLKQVIGANLVPAFQPLVEAASRVQGLMANLFSDGIDAGDIQQVIASIRENFGQAFANLGETLREALPGILDAMRELFAEVAQFASNELPGIMEEIGGFLSDIGQIIQPYLEPIGGAIVDAIGGVLSAVAGQIDWPSLLAGLAEGIVVGIIYLVGEITLKIVDVLGELWQTIAEAIGQGVDSILQGIGQYAQQFADAGRAWIESLGQGITESFSGIGEFFSGLPDQILQSIQSAAQQFVQAGADLVNGLIDGIKQKAQDIVESIMAPVRQAVDSVKNFLGIHSPSRLFEQQIGRQMMAGLSQGIAKNTGGVIRAMDSAVGAVVDTAQAGVGQAIRAGAAAGDGSQTAVSSGAGGYTQNVTINSPQALSPYETARQVRNTTRSMVLSMMTGG